MSMETLKGYALGVVGFAIVVGIGLVILTAFQTAQTNQSGTAAVSLGKFVTGLAAFSDYVTIIVIAVVGVFIIGLIAKKMGN